MKQAIIIGGACALLAGCAGMGRMLEYGGELADARHDFGGRTFSVYVHPTEDVLLVQGSVADSAATVSTTAIRLVAEDFVKPVRCEIGAPKLIAPGSYELPYSCSTVDLRRLVISQRASLQHGAALVTK